MTNDYLVGAARVNKLIQRRGSIGGSKAVFVKVQGVKNQLTYPPIGGAIKNPFKGAAKMFAGDLCEYRTNDKGVNPEIYILKTYQVVSAETTTVKILKDAYKHTPFVGDKLGVAPAKIGGDVTENATILSVSVGMEDNKEVWVLTMSGVITAVEGDILVEVDAENKMMVKNINAVFDADCDMLDAPATGDDDFDGARYIYTPALGGIMYASKMSPLPECVKAVNLSKVNGWFQVQSV